MAEEDDVIFDAEEGDKETVKKLREKLKVAEGKAKEYLDSWQRAQADFVNLRKRDEEARREFSKFASLKLISELVPVLDALSLAIEHGDKGLNQTYNLLLKTLELTEVNPMGEMFDPKHHEAMGMIKTDKESEDHKILEVLQKGYIMGDKVIRPAKVKIGEHHG